MGATEFQSSNPLTVQRWENNRKEVNNMPYRVKGKNVEHYKGGKWKVKQTCSTPQNAYAALALLRSLEKRETGKKGKKS